MLFNFSMNRQTDPEHRLQDSPQDTTRQYQTGVEEVGDNKMIKCTHNTVVVMGGGGVKKAQGIKDFLLGPSDGNNN